MLKPLLSGDGLHNRRLVASQSASKNSAPILAYHQFELGKPSVYLLVGLGIVVYIDNVTSHYRAQASAKSRNHILYRSMSDLKNPGFTHGLISKPEPV